MRLAKIFRIPGGFWRTIRPLANILKGLLHLRPVRHWTERRVRETCAGVRLRLGHEALIARALIHASVEDHDVDHYAQAGMEQIAAGASPRSWNHLEPTVLVLDEIGYCRCPDQRTTWSSRSSAVATSGAA